MLKQTIKTPLRYVRKIRSFRWTKNADFKKIKCYTRYKNKNTSYKTDTQRDWKKSYKKWSKCNTRYEN